MNRDSRAGERAKTHGKVTKESTPARGLAGVNWRQARDSPRGEKALAPSDRAQVTSQIDALTEDGEKAA